jgi:hypothetical protein
MVTGSATALGKQARGPVLLEATQQTKHLAPLQPDQHTGVTDPKTTRLNRNSTSRRLNFCLLIYTSAAAHPPGPQNPGECPLYIEEGVSFLYCAYSKKSDKMAYGKITPLQSAGRCVSYERTLRCVILIKSNIAVAIRATGRKPRLEGGKVQCKSASLEGFCFVCPFLL